MQKSPKPLISYIPAFLEYLEIEKGLAQLSVQNYDRFLSRLKSWLNSNYPNLKPHELSSEIVSKYRLFLAHTKSNTKNDDNLKKNTQNYYLIALRNFLSFLIEKDVESLPPEKIKLAKMDAKDRVVKFLSLDQLERLLLAPDTQTLSGLRDRAILETLYSTGLRVAELASLNRDQFNLKIIANPSLELFELTIVGKGSHPRPVYFSRRCLDWLIKYIEARKDMDNALFVNQGLTKDKDAERRLTIRSIERVLKKYSKMAGLPIIATPHTLRHTYATDLLNQGADLRTVQEFLGHQNISTTQIYTHVTNKRLKDLHEKFHSGKDLKNS